VFLEQYREALQRFGKGDPEGVKALYSQADDVVLANPFGPAVVGWDSVGPALEFAASHFRDGDCDAFDLLLRHDDAETAVVHATENWRLRLVDRSEVEPVRLRVTTVLRREDGGWRMVLRHADPIATANDSGPLRGT
jgi:ketosteroid isomerase-like protein